MDDFEAEFENTGDFFPDGEMVELKSGVGCDGLQHVIIMAKVWKANVLGDGEYRYWNFAPWQPCAKHCGSVRDWVVNCVVEVERMAKSRLGHNGLKGVDGSILTRQLSKNQRERKAAGTF
jgi:hypothetical protein